MPWYPTQERVKGIERELGTLEQPSADDGVDLADFLVKSCSVVRDMLRNGTISEALTRDWITIAAYYRRFGDKSEAIRRYAGAGLRWLHQHSQSENYNDDSRAELRWTTDLVRARVHEHAPESGVHKHLSDNELAATTERWEAFKADDSLDINTITLRLQPYLRHIGDMTSDFYLPGVRDQIRDLLNEVQEGGPAAAPCRAALRYLGEKDDVISDDLGYVGLLDDLYVIDVAHRELTGQVSWGALLDRFIAEWPFIEQLVFFDAGQETSLPPFMQMITGAILSTFQDKKSTYISLHETGPAALIGAFFATVDSLRRQRSDGAFDERPLDDGDHVLLGDDTTTIKAIYRGVSEIQGQKFVFIELSGDARQGLPPSLMPTLRRAPAEHRRLSTAKAFHQWKDQERPQLLHHFVGGEIHPDTVRPEVLLVVPRQDLDELVYTLRPMGSSIPDLVGCQYISRTGESSYIRGNNRQRPMITVCSDPTVGSEFLAGCDEDTRPSCIICDATTLSSADLRSLLESADRHQVTTAILGPRHARDLRILAEQNNFRIWPIAQSEVEPMALGNPVNVPDRSGPIRCYTARQRLSSHVLSDLHECDDETVQAVSTALGSLRESKNQEQDEAFVNVSILTSEVLKLLRLDIADFDEEHKRRLVDAANLCSMHASTLGLYDERVGSLAGVMSSLSRGERPGTKARAIEALLTTHTKGQIGVLCPSYRLATLARQYLSDQQGETEPVWITFRELRSGLPLDRLIVPGWLGRAAMRELASSGFARRIDYVFYPCEEQWHSRSAQTAAREYRRLDADKDRIWRDQEEKYQGLGNKPTFAASQPAPEPPANDDDDSIDDEDWITEAITDMARKRASIGQDPNYTTRARLILFEEPDYYIYAPPNGKVICLSALVDERRDISEMERVERRGLEDLIMLPISQVRPGALLAFALERSADAIDILSNQILKNPRKTRAAASRWREALLRFAVDQHLQPYEVANRLSAAGLTRTEHTVRNWLYSDSIVAPLNWKNEIPIIAEMTGDELLLSGMTETFKQIPKLYEARRKAAQELIKLFINQDLDLGSDEAVLTVGDNDIHYRLLRVRKLGPVAEVDGEYVGELQRFFVSATAQIPLEL